MTETKIDLAILNAARLEFAEQILPELDGPNRYIGAMIIRALDVLRAQAVSDTSPRTILPDAGFGTPEALAAQLRAERPIPSRRLRAALQAFVEAKLGISNPKFLAATREGTGGAHS